MFLDARCQKTGGTYRSYYLITNTYRQRQEKMLYINVDIYICIFNTMRDVE